jgi:hypothetical protein
MLRIPGVSKPLKNRDVASSKVEKPDLIGVVRDLRDQH